jgi:hypothetical protein
MSSSPSFFAVVFTTDSPSSVVNNQVSSFFTFTNISSLKPFVYILSALILCYVASDVM